MFAYCNNNPVAEIDPSGEFSFLVTCLAVFFVATFVGCEEKIYSNAQKSHKADSSPETTTHNKIIESQHSTYGDNFAYGLRLVRDNGCEVIAVHNAKVLLGYDSYLSDTMDDFRSVCGMMLWGIWGSDPYAVGSVLKKEGVPYKRIGLDEVKKDGVYIVSYWLDNKPWNGLHTIAVTACNGELTGYNYQRGVTPLNLSEISNGFITAYYLG